MLKENLDQLLDKLSDKPLCTLQASYMIKGVNPDLRFGYCCEGLADFVVDYVSSLGYDSYKVKPTNVMHISTLTVDGSGRIYLADPGLLIKESVDVTDVIKNPGKSVCADYYSEIPGRKVEIRGTEDGFQIIKNSVSWIFNDEQSKTFDYRLDVLKNQTLMEEKPRRILPLFRVVDQGRPLSMLFTPESHYVKGYDGYIVYGDTSDIESRIIGLMGTGVTIRDLREYTNNCLNLYNGRKAKETLVLQN